MSDHTVRTYSEEVANHLLKIKGVKCCKVTEQIVIDIHPEAYQTPGVIRGNLDMWNCHIPRYVNAFRNQKTYLGPYDNGPESSGLGFQ